MAGHNKWSKIKRKKGALDAKRSKIYSKLIKEITVAVKEGNSGDEEFNPRLRLAIANAKGVNMPKENIDRAIKKALEKDSSAIFQPTYEGYGSGGVAIFVETATDNLNRTVSSVRAIFNKHNGSLATSGSVDYLFDRKGVFILELEEERKDEIELDLIDGGAEEIEYDPESKELEITVSFEDFGRMQDTLENLNLEAKSATLERIPNVFTKLNIEDARKVLSLIEALEDDDDVQQVFHNLEMTEELESVLEE